MHRKAELPAATSGASGGHGSTRLMTIFGSKSLPLSFGHASVAWKTDDSHATQRHITWSKFSSLRRRTCADAPAGADRIECGDGLGGVHPHFADGRLLPRVRFIDGP